MKTTLLLNAVLLAALLPTCLAAATCAADTKDFCTDCYTQSSCDGLNVGETPANRQCGTGTVCKETGDGASCVPEAEVPECACSAQVMCDKYDPTVLRVCAGGALVEDYPCPENEVCISDSGTCDDPPTTTTTETPTTTAAMRPTTEGCTADDIFKNKPTSPDCREYALCNGENALVNLTCEAGSYLDGLTGSCAAAPPQPCSGGCEGDYCSDPLDCTHYHKCKAGKVVSTFICTADDGKFYDYKTGKCGSNVKNCDPRTACVHGATGTTTTTATPATTTTTATTATTPSNTTPSTEDPSSEGTTTTPSGSGAVTSPSPSACSSSTAYQIWPDPEDCKGYYRCLPTESGSFAMARGKCSGRLEFNSEKNQCDLKGRGDC